MWCVPSCVIATICVWVYASVREGNWSLIQPTMASWRWKKIAEVRVSMRCLLGSSRKRLEVNRTPRQSPRHSAFTETQRKNSTQVKTRYGQNSPLLAVWAWRVSGINRLEGFFFLWFSNRLIVWRSRCSLNVSESSLFLFLLLFGIDFQSQTKTC